ncbi:Protein of unknown function [Gryllus bimaculatus]|nr:Protein of unknown function [Gryllus bimaculatus]
MPRRLVPIAPSSPPPSFRRPIAPWAHFIAPLAIAPPPIAPPPSLFIAPSATARRPIASPSSGASPHRPTAPSRAGGARVLPPPPRESRARAARSARVRSAASWRRPGRARPVRSARTSGRARWWTPPCRSGTTPAGEPCRSKIRNRPPPPGQPRRAAPRPGLAAQRLAAKNQEPIICTWSPTSCSGYSPLRKRVKPNLNIPDGSCSNRSRLELWVRIASKACMIPTGKKKKKNIEEKEEEEEVEEKEEEKKKKVCQKKRKEEEKNIIEKRNKKGDGEKKRERENKRVSNGLNNLLIVS